MSILQKYFGLCTICNVIMVGLVLMISSQHILNNTLSNIIIFFAFINMLKVINQFRILKSLGDGINNMVSLISDRIFDFIKFVIYTIIIVSFQSFCITELATYIFVTICINYAAIIMQFFINLIKPNLLLIQLNQVFIINNNAHNANITNNQDIYINMPENTNIINYMVDKSNNSTCAICLDEQQIKEHWSILNCSHEFHNKCISSWIQRENTCPTCRCAIN